jgi:hypothetical protein
MLRWHCIKAKLEKNLQKAKEMTKGQDWARSGPRATSDPQGTLMLPGSYNCRILNSYFYIENMLKNPEKF